jgi:hypothetical protein
MATLSLPAYERAIIAELEHGSWWDFARTVQRYAADYPDDPAHIGPAVIKRLKLHLDEEEA